MKIWMTMLASAVCLAGCAVPAEKAVSVKSMPSASRPAETQKHRLVRPAFDLDAATPALTGFPANANVRRFIDYEAAAGRFSRSELEDFFSEARYKDNIITIMNRPATSLPWYKFRQNNSGAGKVNGGKAFYAQYRHIIDKVARQYGVPAEIIVAIIGIETNYGRNMGTIRLADSLPTLGFGYPRRSEFFQNELGEFLLMSREEQRNPFSFVGSYAGAMGMPQFMPSSYRKWAVDFDGDGQRNIWSSIPDVAASVANYMKAHDWQTGGKVMVPAVLEINPKLQALIDEKTALNYTVADFKKMGVIPMGDVADDERAVLFGLETSPGVREYFLGFNNFYTIWRYNNSRMYAAAVREIANGIGRGGL